MRNVFRNLALPAAAIALVMAVSVTSAVAQDDAFTVGYYSNANTTGAPDAHLRLTNDGNTGTDLWANIYVFNNNEEMEECCSCEVTPDGYLDLDLNSDLLGAPLVPADASTSGIIKVISDSAANNETAPHPSPGLRGWITHIQTAVTKFPNGDEIPEYSVTESDLKDSKLSKNEEATLASTCNFVLAEGSGVVGQCSCALPGVVVLK